MITLKSAHEIELMRRAGKITAAARAVARDMVKPGVTTQQIDKAVHRFITEQGAIPSFLHYNGYPASVCVSVNDEIIHGIPGKRVLQEGDIVSVDVDVTGENVVFTKINQVLNVYVEVFKGGQRLKYGTSKDGFSCSTLSSGHYLLDNNVYWGFTTDDGGYRFCYRLALMNKSELNNEIPFTITAIGIPYSRTLRISTFFSVENGAYP